MPVIRKMKSGERIMKKLLIFLFLCMGFIGCVTSDSAEPDHTFSQRLDSLFQIGHVPGAVLVMIRNFEVDRTMLHGVKDSDTREPVTAETLFQAASISKPVSAVAAMKLVQDGLVSLNGNVNNQLVSWQVPDNQYTVSEKVTLKRLLAHRGGIPQGGKVGMSRDQEYPTLLQMLMGDPPYSPVVVTYIPGSEFIYSNEGFCIIQQLLIDVSGKTFENLLKETVLDPLQMGSSTFYQVLPPELEARAASGHSGFDVIDGRYQWHPKLAAAGLWTTAGDLAKFMIELLRSVNGESNRILSRAVVLQMVEPVTVFDDSKDYGLGIGIKYFGGEPYYWHSGGFEGFNCVMYGHASGVGMVLMTNHCDAEWETFADLIGTEESWPGF